MSQHTFMYHSYPLNFTALPCPPTNPHPHPAALVHCLDEVLCRIACSGDPGLCRSALQMCKAFEARQERLISGVHVSCGTSHDTDNLHIEPTQGAPSFPSVQKLTLEQEIQQLKTNIKQYGFKQEVFRRAAMNQVFDPIIVQIIEKKTQELSPKKKRQLIKSMLELVKPALIIEFEQYPGMLQKYHNLQDQKQKFQTEYSEQFQNFILLFQHLPIGMTEMKQVDEIYDQYEFERQQLIESKSHFEEECRKHIIPSVANFVRNEFDFEMDTVALSLKQLVRGKILNFLKELEQEIKTNEKVCDSEIKAESDLKHHIELLQTLIESSQHKLQEFKNKYYFEKFHDSAIDMRMDSIKIEIEGFDWKLTKIKLHKKIVDLLISKKFDPDLAKKIMKEFFLPTPDSFAYLQKKDIDKSKSLDIDEKKMTNIILFNAKVNLFEIDFILSKQEEHLRSFVDEFGIETFDDLLKLSTSQINEAKSLKTEQKKKLLELLLIEYLSGNKFLHETAREFVQEFKLEKIDDIFHLTMEDVKKSESLDQSHREKFQIMLQKFKLTQEH